jgi:hypothetical protein
MRLPDLILGVLAVYLSVGAIAAIALVASGVSRLDPATRGAPWSFRAIILPGLVALWPVLVAKWLHVGQPGVGR